MKTAVVIGGSSGLGLSIVESLLTKEIKVVCISRTKPHISHPNLFHYLEDLLDLTQFRTQLIFKEHPDPDLLCFAQRYRNSGDTCPIEEYNVMVRSTALIIEQALATRTVNSGDSPLRSVIIGSTYSSSAGFDQGWSYHAAKSAQAAIVRYFATSYCGRIIINMVSPPTYVKENAAAYWSSTTKNKRWISVSSLPLITVKQVAEAVCTVLLNESHCISGNNILSDYGLSNLYFDQ